VDDETQVDQADQEGTGYEYLFTINVRGFTTQKVAELIKQKDNKKAELDEVQGTPPKTFWRRDLEALLEEWDLILVQDEEDLAKAKPLATAAPKKRKRVVKPKVKAEDK
jgi:DNA topoisomerase-2